MESPVDCLYRTDAKLETKFASCSRQRPGPVSNLFAGSSLAVVLFLAGAVVGCGGGSGGSANSNSSANLPSVPATAIVSFSDVPAAGRGMVVTISSVDGNVPAATTQQLVVSHDLPVFALDSLGNIVLATRLSADSKLVFSPENTALTLAKLLVNTESYGITPAEFTERLKASGTMQALVDAITNALSSGQSPSTSATVLDLLAQSVETAIATTSQSGSPLGGILNKPFDQPTVSHRLPYELIGPKVLLIDDAPGLFGGAVRVSNTKPVHWTINNLPLAAATPLQPFEAFDPHVDLNHGGKHLVVDVRFSEGSTVIDIFVETISLAFSILKATSCKPSDFAGVFTPLEAETVASAATGKEALLRTLVLSTRKTLELVATCLNVSTTGLERYFGPIVKFLAGNLTKLYDGYSLAAKLQHYFDFRGKQPKSVGVCIGGNRIVNCATRFDLLPAPFVMYERDVVDLLVVAFAGAQQTIAPTELEVAAILKIPPVALADNKSIAGLGTGNTDVVIKDTITGAESKVPVEVINPVFNTNPVIVTKGQSILVGLKDPQGRQVARSSKVLFGFRPSSDHVSLVATPIFSDTVGVKGERVGETELIAYELMSGVPIASTMVKVEEPPELFYVGEFTQTNCEEICSVNGAGTLDNPSRLYLSLQRSQVGVRTSGSSPLFVFFPSGNIGGVGSTFSITYDVYWGPPDHCSGTTNGPVTTVFTITERNESQIAGTYSATYSIRRNSFPDPCTGEIVQTSTAGTFFLGGRPGRFPSESALLPGSVGCVYIPHQNTYYKWLNAVTGPWMLGLENLYDDKNPNSCSFDLEGWPGSLGEIN